MDEFYELLEWIAYITAVLGWEDNEGISELMPDTEELEAVSGLGDVYNILYDSAVNAVDTSNAVYETGQGASTTGLSLYETSLKDIDFYNASGLVNSVYTYLSTDTLNNGLTYTQITNTSTENEDKSIQTGGKMWTDTTALTYDTVSNQAVEVLTNAVSVSGLSNSLYNSENNLMPYNVYNAFDYGVTDRSAYFEGGTAFNKGVSSVFESADYCINSVASYLGGALGCCGNEAVYNDTVFDNAVSVTGYNWGSELYLNNVQSKLASLNATAFSISAFDTSSYVSSYRVNEGIKSSNTEFTTDYGIDNSQAYEDYSGTVSNNALLSTLVNSTTATRPSININVDFKAYADIKNDYDTERFTQVFVDRLREELTEYAEGIHF